MPRPISSSTIRLRGGRGVEDHGGLGHLDHERGSAAREIVGRADAGEDAIDDRQQRGIGGNEGTHLRQDRQQRGLAKIGGFAAHVGAGDDGDELGFGMEVEIVGDEALGVFFGQFFDHRMAAGDDVHFAVMRRSADACSDSRRRLRRARR